MLLSRLYIVIYKWSHNKITEFSKFNLKMHYKKHCFFLLFETASQCIIVPLDYQMPLFYKICLSLLYLMD